ncbi:MAG: DNA primase [Deltaproteobacteria bacterium]|nr:DNA primase [Deltaproteobacteria bacterium]
MAGYDRAKVQQILDRVSIKDVVQEYVTLQKAGREYKGLCPFHQEKTPSFHVIEHKKFFYCFGCQVGGDAVRFLQMAAGLSRSEAIRRLARRAGVDLGPEGPADPKVEAAERKRSDLIHANQVAQTIFRANLNGPEGEQARAYLDDRGISPAIAEQYGLGYGGSQRGHLIDELKKRKVRLRHAGEAGILVPSKFGDSDWYEKFLGRLLFPIFDLDGAVIAFSGRLIPPMEEGPKYTNSHESPIFQKGNSVFGLYQARSEIRKAKQTIVVEGNFDVLAMAAAGFGNVVAPLGTALTRSQVIRLKRFAGNIVLVFDGDEAGRKASRKSVGLLVEAEVEGHVALMPVGEDPDSLLRSSGKEGLRKLLARARPMIRYLIESLVEVHGRSPHGLRKVVEEAKEVFSLDRDPIRFGLYREELARILGMDVRELKRMLRDPRAARDEKGDVAPCPVPEKTLLELMLLYPRFIKRFIDEGDPAWVTHVEAREVLQDIQTHSLGGEVDPAEAIVTGAEDGGPLRSAVIEVFRRPDTFREELADQAFSETLAELHRLALTRERKELEVSLQTSESEASPDDVNEMAVRISRLNRSIRELEREAVRNKYRQKEHGLTSGAPALHGADNGNHTVEVNE